MKRRDFIKTSALSVPAAFSAPYLNFNKGTEYKPYLDIFTGPDAKRVKITDVKCIRTNIGLRVSPLVKIETDEGIVGIGECHHDENGYGAQDVVHSICKPILMDQDPFDLERLVFKMSTRTSYYGGNHGMTTHAITGVEMAMWDLIGKITNQPVHKILGGGSHVNQVRAYLSSGPRNMLDKDSCQEFAALVDEEGWTAAKINFLRDQQWNRLDNRRISNVEIDRNEKAYANVREAVGWEFDIAVHCHWELDFDGALRLSRAVAPMRPWWIEDPMPIAYNEQWARLTAQSEAPILCGENLYTRADFRPFIVNAGVNMIEIDVAMAGGLLEAKKIADLAELYYIPVATHNVAGPIATVASANLAASVREFLGHEIFSYNGNYLTFGEFGLHGNPAILGYDKELVVNGHIQLSDRPGFGIELDDDLVKSYLPDDQEYWD